jgi:hypothetical protein
MVLDRYKVSFVYQHRKHYPNELLGIDKNRHLIDETLFLPLEQVGPEIVRLVTLLRKFRPSHMIMAEFTPVVSQEHPSMAVTPPQTL